MGGFSGFQIPTLIFFGISSRTKSQKYPQYCWEFHDRLWEALSGTTSKKRGVPSRTGGKRILEMLWKPQMPWIIGLGASQPYSRREFQETLWERFRGLSGIFPEFLPERASRTGGMAQKGVSIKGASMKRSNFLRFRVFYTGDSKGDCQKSPEHGYPFCANPLGRSFLLTGKSFLLTVGLGCLRSIGLVFFAYGWNSVWSFLLTVVNRFGLFYLRLPPVRKLGLVFFAYGSPRLEIGFGLFCLRFPHRK